MIIFKTRSHWRSLALPGLTTIVLIALGVFLTTLRHRVESFGYYTLVVWVVMAAAWIPLGLVPFLKWFCSTDTLTETQLRSEEGVIKRSSTTIPLERVAATNVVRTAADRFFRSGTIQVQTAGTDSTVELDKAPRARRLEKMINDQVQRVRADQQSGD